MGTAEFAVPPLRMLAGRSDVEVVLVVSQPDRPAGRGRQPQPPPVAVAARELGLDLFQPESLKSDEAFERLSALRPELIVVTAYGQILRQRVLDIPRHGCVNVHASLLPRWRGAAPISWAVTAGDAVTGVAVMRMERGLDTGPVLDQRVVMIRDAETAGELHDRLAPLGAELLGSLLPGILDGSVEPVPQPQARSSYARMLTRADRRVDFAAPARAVADHVNGMTPWPGAATRIGDELVLLCRAAAAGDSAGGLAPATVVAADERGLIVACGDGQAVRILELQRAGRRRMAASEALRGWSLAPGTQLADVD
jgi:methionyl-tRNA formyltransferase